MIGKLGKLQPRDDARTLKLSNYATAELPPPPDELDFGTPVDSWPMYLNDILGVCTCATAGHLVDGWRHAALGEHHAFTNEQILDAYKAVSGYDGRPETDNGAVELDVLKHWRSKGIGGHRIGAFAYVNPNDFDLIRHTIHLFGGAYIGLALPKSIHNTGQDECWTVTDPTLQGRSKPGSLGGHAVHLCGFKVVNGERWYLCVTWGRLQWMTEGFLSAYLDEAWAVLSNDWIGPDAKSPVGFDFDALRADLSLVGWLPRQTGGFMDEVSFEIEKFLQALLQVLRDILNTEGGKAIMKEIDKQAVLAALRGIASTPEVVWKFLKDNAGETGPAEAERKGDSLG